MFQIFLVSVFCTDFAPEGTHIKLRFNCDTKNSNDLLIFPPNGKFINKEERSTNKEEDERSINKEEEKSINYTGINYVSRIGYENPGQEIALYLLISWFLIMILINGYLSLRSSSENQSSKNQPSKNQPSKNQPSKNQSSKNQSSSGKSIEQVLECFSIRENVHRLNDEDLNDDFKFIYGFRMVFLIGSTIFHVFFLPIFWSPLAVINLLNFSREGHTWLNQEFGSNMSAGMPLAFVMA